MISKVLCVWGIITMWLAEMVVESGDFWPGFALGVFGLALMLPKLIKWIAEDISE